MKHKLYLLIMIVLPIVVGTLAIAAFIASPEAIDTLFAKFIAIATIIIGYVEGIRNTWKLIGKPKSKI